MTREREDLSGSFEPRMLIDVVMNQAPEYDWLPGVLRELGPGHWESRAYVGYVSRQNPNQPGAQWQFETNVVVDHPVLGMVVLDILKGDCLGGIEFVDRIET